MTAISLISMCIVGNLLPPQGPAAQTPTIKEVRLLPLSDTYFSQISEFLQKRGASLTQVVSAVSGSFTGGSGGGGYTGTSFRAVFIGAMQKPVFPVRGKYVSEPVKIPKLDKPVSLEINFNEEGLKAKISYDSKSINVDLGYVIGSDRLIAYRVINNEISSSPLHDNEWSDGLRYFDIESSLIYDPATKTVRSVFGRYQFEKGWTEIKLTKSP